MRKNLHNINNYSLIINKYIDDYFKNLQILPQYKSVVEAMRYSLNAGGKRIRPILVLEFYQMCDGKSDILPLACCLEFVHTYSLIHDDLPCMDDDDFRRGQPSCHKKFEENIALLAGDALQTLAFEIIAKSAINGVISSENAVKISYELSKSIGFSGMIGGQVIDLENEKKKNDIDTLRLQDNLKTGALFSAACKIGVILAGGSAEKIQFANEFAENFGLAFQIVDDILDKIGDAKMLGKPLNSDEKNNKNSYVAHYGIEKSKEIAKNLTENAVELLGNFENNEFLVNLTNDLLDRNF